MDEPDTDQPRAFVIGHPIGHSRSPLIHRHWLKQAGLNGSYQPIDVAPEQLPGFVAALKDGSSGFVGGNVTLPHKEAILGLVDEIDDTAQQIGAVNTLWLDHGRLMASNTDSHGFSANLDAAAPGWDNGPTAVVLGAGGASRAVIHALLARGFRSIHLANRTGTRAQALADQFGDRVFAHGIDELQKLVGNANFFVNTTSMGMGGSPVPEVDFTVMAGNAVVTDIVYMPLETPILAMARHQGLATVDGLGMLLHQAVPGFARWFGHTPRVTTELRQLIIDDMEAKS